MAEYETGWEDPDEIRGHVAAYDALLIELARPLDLMIPEADLNEFRPKYKHHHDHHHHVDYPHEISREPDGAILYAMPEYSSSDDENDDHQRAFFHPPLQIQRNQFVKKFIERLRDDTFEISKIGVMGCGEMSLERHLLPSLHKFGTKMLLSVDIDKHSLSIGSQLIEKAIKNHEPSLQYENGYPVMIRAYYGDILQHDYRFANADVIVSMEVIEHMPLLDAKRFINIVLGVLCPRMFIFSTPNHDFNAAFGDKPGEFRHDDHKFEMTAHQFVDYLKELRRLHPNYEIGQPHYIGFIPRFSHLHGATQAAIAILKDPRCVDPKTSDRPYKAVYQTMLPVGVKTMIYQVLKDTFVEWLKITELKESELQTHEFSQYWLIDIKRILHHIRAPVTITTLIDEKEAVEMLTSNAPEYLFPEFTHGFAGLGIMHRMKKSILIAKFQNPPV
ncbi:unnamed protein product [Caenorhabditis bovis]|uniref:Small RNA 2'-O-methyltransferase n=1 Tax=Caenorhabditis bovis TaxID=2654633 RepID=A0A8S1EPZ0_9PELO|nr:unnamed protein product [Caenorhabditis bovis]